MKKLLLLVWLTANLNTSHAAMYHPYDIQYSRASCTHIVPEREMPVFEMPVFEEDITLADGRHIKKVDMKELHKKDMLKKATFFMVFFTKGLYDSVNGYNFSQSTWVSVYAKGCEFSDCIFTGAVFKNKIVLGKIYKSNFSQTNFKRSIWLSVTVDDSISFLEADLVGSIWNIKTIEKLRLHKKGIIPFEYINAFVTYDTPNVPVDIIDQVSHYLCGEKWRTTTL